MKGEHEEADNKDYEELLKSWVMSVGVSKKLSIWN